jgi:glycosyltransferase involved in cell wall biosynthesis
VETLDRLLSDPHYYQEIAETGNRFVHEHYDWENATRNLEALFRKS